MKMWKLTLLLALGLQFSGCAEVAMYRLGIECEGAIDKQAYKPTEFVDDVTHALAPLGLVPVERTQYEIDNGAIAAFIPASSIKRWHEYVYIRIWQSPDLRITIGGKGSYSSARVNSMVEVLQPKFKSVCQGQAIFEGGYDWFSRTGRI